ncbi:hypothetical protein V8E36_003733 [Tilletia maclaganii]
MGADGGSIPRREELVRTRARDNTATAQDPALVLRALWTLCALSRLPLSKPIVSDPTGRIYNKEAVVKFLLARADPNAELDPLDEAVAGHLKGLKDMKELSLEPNPAFRRKASPTGADDRHASSAASSSTVAAALPAMADSTGPFPFVCALTQKELNGKSRFVFLRSCGCVLAETGLRTVAGGSAAVAAKRAGKDKADNGDDASRLASYDCPLCNKPFRASPAFFSNARAAGSSDAPEGVGKQLTEAAAAEAATALLRYDPQGDIVPLNPPPAQQDALRAALLASRMSSKKRKAGVIVSGVSAVAADSDGGAQGGERDGGTAAADKDEAKAKKKTEAKAARQVAIAKLQAELADDGSNTVTAADTTGPTPKRARKDPPAPSHTAGFVPGMKQPQDKKEMSAAVRSIYGLDRPKDPKGESWMVRGTFNRYA